MPAPPLRSDGKLETTVTYLEMRAAPSGPPWEPPREGLAIVRAERPTASFYRYLYDTVGERWLWGDRRRLGTQALLAIIRHPDVEVHVLWDHGVPAGYAELDGRVAGELELSYFGLLPDFIGQRLGPYLLDWTIRRAWTKAPARLWVHTCTLDHPSALPLYQRCGFVPYQQATESGEDPRALGLIPTRGAGLR